MTHSIILVASLSFLATAGLSNAQTVSVYASAPGAQTVLDSGYTTAAGYTSQTEGFEGITATTSGTAFPTPYTSPNIASPAATFTSTGTVNLYAAGTSGESQYGGYNQNKFLAVTAGPSNSAIASFATPVGYVGFLFPAADAGNTIQIYGTNGTIIGTFVTSDLTRLLSSKPTQTSADGRSTYASSAYYGQPTTGFNSGEPYAYLSFVPSANTSISKIVLTQAAGSPGTFEADNFSVISGRPAALGSLVLVSTVPEPSTWATLGLGGVILLGLVRHQRRHGGPGEQS